MLLWFSDLPVCLLCVCGVSQDGDILASSFPVDTQVAYILSLGVVKEFRKHGIGTAENLTLSSSEVLLWNQNSFPQCV